MAGECDFEMARAVARQCQMDPKLYLPLLESFQTIGAQHSAESMQHSAMRFHVNVHLKRFELAVVWGMALLRRGSAVSLRPSEPHEITGTSQYKVNAFDFEYVVDTLFKIIADNDLYHLAIPMLNKSSLHDSVTACVPSSSTYSNSNSSSSSKTAWLQCYQLQVQPSALQRPYQHRLGMRVERGCEGRVLLRMLRFAHGASLASKQMMQVVQCDNSICCVGMTHS